MTSSDDLVWRLREGHGRDADVARCVACGSLWPCDKVQAADEIDRLRASGGAPVSPADEPRWMPPSERQAVLDAINLYGDEALHHALDSIGWPEVWATTAPDAGSPPGEATPAESVLRRLLDSGVADVYGTSLEFRDDDGSWVYNLHLSDAETDLCMRLATASGDPGEETRP